MTYEEYLDELCSMRQLLRDILVAKEYYENRVAELRDIFTIECYDKELAKANLMIQHFRNEARIVRRYRSRLASWYSVAFNTAPLPRLGE